MNVISGISFFFFTTVFDSRILKLSRLLLEYLISSSQIDLWINAVESRIFLYPKSFSGSYKFYARLK